MGSNQITVFDSKAEQAIKLSELIATTLESARQILQTPQIEHEMKNLIGDALAMLGKQVHTLLDWEAAEEFEATHWAEIQACAGSELVAKTASWYAAFSTQFIGRYLAQLKQNVQITERAARISVDLAEKYIPLTPDSKGEMLLETALRCGVTAPAFSAEIMMRAFELAPDLLKNKAEHLKGFVYEQGKHSQEAFSCCPSCGGIGEAYHTACSCYMNDYSPMFLPAKLWMRCPDCGILYTRWFSKEFLAMSQEPYLVYPQPDQITIQPANSMLLRSWNDILNSMRELCDSPGNDVLEVGVGNGNLIAVAQEMGYDVSAVEIAKQTAQNAANLLDLPILCGDFLRMPEDRQYDMITMGDVLEHLRSPSEGMAKAYRLLKQGGVLWVSTPNYESAFTTMMKMNDPMWREPHHITYFSRKSLTRLAEQTGFQVMQYSVSNHYNGSMELLLKRNK